MSEHFERLKSALSDRYAIDREIGRGGMAVVYLAEDRKHGRRVAIKVLQPSVSATLGTDRFLKEIETAARLQHPHILPLYDSGEADGFLFYVMPYVEGESLRDRIDREGQLPVEEAVRLAREVADGLGYAHGEGVIHRDIKPSNVMLQGGHAVVADFGIAQAVDEAGGERLTATGVSTGSPVYMSPEQARGVERLDARTDLYSLGCVLYEMLAGEAPFTGGTRASITARKEMEAAPELTTLRDTVPESVAAAVRKALARAPADRFQTAEKFEEALKEGPATATSGASRRKLPRILVATMIGLLVLAGLVALLQLRGGGTAGPELAMDGPEPAIAVLPFSVRGEGLEVWREGMVDALSANLEGIPGFRSVPSTSVHARWQRATEPDGTADLPTALSVAGGLGADFAIMGRAISSGPELRFDADVHDVTTGEIIHQVRVEGAPEEALSLVDDLSLRIIQAIGQGELGEPPQFDLAGSMSPSIDAVKAYLEGEAHFRRSDFETAARHYQRAIAADSTFVRAYFRLADAYSWADGGHSQRYREARENVGRRITSTPSDLPMALEYLAETGQYDELLELAERATRDRSQDPRPWFLLGEAYTHAPGHAMLLEPGSEAEAMSRAIAADSGFTLAYGHLINARYRLDPDSAAIAWLIDRYEAHGADSSEVEAERLAFWIAFGDAATRDSAYGRLGPDSWPVVLTPTANAGRWDMAHPLFLPQRAEVVRRAAATWEDDLEPEFSDWMVVRTALDRGRIAEAVEELGARGLPEALLLPEVYRAYAQGLPLPPGIVQGILGSGVSDTVMGIEYRHVWDGGTRTPLFYVAAYRTAAGEPEAARDAVARMRAAAEYHAEEGDSRRARLALGAAQALEGLDAWKNEGDPDRARQLFEAAQGGDLRLNWVDNRVVRWWLAELLVETGDLEAAIPYYLSLTIGEPSGIYDPPAMYRLGQVYERLGETEKARDAYAWVLLAWRYADASMRPWVEEIEGRLRVLGADIGS